MSDPPRPPRLTFFRGRDGKHYFRVQAGGNLAELARSTDGYDDLDDAREAANLLALALGTTELEVVEELEIDETKS